MNKITEDKFKEQCTFNKIYFQKHLPFIKILILGKQNVSKRSHDEKLSPKMVKDINIRIFT